MRAARLMPGARGVQVVDVPIPEPSGTSVRIRVAAAGVCRSDVHSVDGHFDHLLRLPVTLGHEVSGVVDALGPEAAGPAPGTPVVVMVGWGCGTCRWCREGRHQICPEGDEAGATVDGGFADYMLVPHPQYLVPLGSIDPLTATPFGCAALTAFAAVTRVLPNLREGSSLAVVGTGGLGTYAVHYASRLSSASIVAVDERASAIERALDAGAHEGLVADTATHEAVLAALGRARFDAVLDFVGNDQSLALAAQIVARRGTVALLGLADGQLPFGFGTLPPEASLTTVVAGTIRDLHDVVRLAQVRVLHVPQVAFPLEEADRAIALLRAGQIDGRAVLVPSGGAA
mgnify:CR=1 FL=1